MYIFFDRQNVNPAAGVTPFFQLAEARRPYKVHGLDCARVFVDTPNCIFAIRTFYGWPTIILPSFFGWRGIAHPTS